METFEYCTAFIVWEDSKRAYVEKDRNGYPSDAQINNLSGIDAILNNYGSKGWELVTMVIENSTAYTGGWSNSLSNYYTSAYKAIFKRRK